MFTDPLETVAFFGGEEELLRAFPDSLTKKGLYQWRRRGRVPSEWRLTLGAKALDLGLLPSDLTLAAFLGVSRADTSRSAA